MNIKILNILFFLSLFGFLSGCGPKEKAPDKIKRKVDSLDKEVMEQLKQEKDSTKEKE